jgi:hypothetical protein
MSALNNVEHTVNNAQRPQVPCLHLTLDNVEHTVNNVKHNLEYFFQLYTEQCRAVKEPTEVSRGQRRSAGDNGGQPVPEEVNRGQKRSTGVNGGQPGSTEVSWSHSGHKIGMEKCFLCFEPASILCLHCRQGSGNVHLILVYLFKFLCKIFPLHLSGKR